MKKFLILTFAFILFIGDLLAQVPRRNLIELFVNSECVPCSTVYPNEAAELALKDSVVSSITYSMSWPGQDNNYYYYHDGMDHRKDFYQIHSIPASRSNGNYGFNTGTVGTSPISLTNRVFEIRSNNDLQDSIVMQTSIIASQPLNPGYFLYMALTERAVSGGLGASGISSYRHVLRHFFGTDSFRTVLPEMMPGDTLVFEHKVKKTDFHFNKRSELAGLSFVQEPTGSTRAVIQSSVIQPFEDANTSARTKLVRPFSDVTANFTWKLNSYHPDTLFVKVVPVNAPPSSWSVKLKAGSDSGTTIRISLDAKSYKKQLFSVSLSAQGEEGITARYRVSARYKSQSQWMDSIIGLQFISRQPVVLITSNNNTAGYMSAEIGQDVANAGIPFKRMEYSDFASLEVGALDTVVFPAIFYIAGGSYSSSIKPAMAHILDSYFDKGGRFFICFLGAGSVNDSYCQSFIQNKLGVKISSNLVTSSQFSVDPSANTGPWFSNLPSLSGSLFGSSMYLNYVMSLSGNATSAMVFNHSTLMNAVVKNEGSGYRSVFGHVSLHDLLPESARYELIREVYRFLFQHSVQTGVESHSTKANVSIFPVPAADRVRIQLPVSVDKGQSIFVVDATGRRVFECDGIVSSFEISVANWPSGVYQLVTEGIDRVSRRFIVNR